MSKLVPWHWKRRNFLQTLGWASTLLFPRIALAAKKCEATPYTEDGPLYPPTEIPWGSDLTQVPEQEGHAVGQIAYLFGQVRGFDCQPVGGAVVEIWQADNKGYYKHPRHPAPDGLDPCFRYFSKVKTDAHGRYLFKTIVPKWYRIFDIDRAAHIHLKVWSQEDGVITTEVYFSGDDQDKLRKIDRVFQSRSNKNELIVQRESHKTYSNLAIPFDENAAYCNLDLAFEL